MRAWTLRATGSEERKRKEGTRVSSGVRDGRDARARPRFVRDERRRGGIVFRQCDDVDDAGEDRAFIDAGRGDALATSALDMERDMQAIFKM